MSFWTKLIGIGALGVTLSSSVPAWALTYWTTYNADRVNTAGASLVTMTPSATTFCYLSRVGVENTDTDGELAQCKVTRGTSSWVLEAYLGKSSDADARCSAICYYYQ
jgi:hypothetical protein